MSNDGLRIDIIDQSHGDSAVLLLLRNFLLITTAIMYLIIKLVIMVVESVRKFSNSYGGETHVWILLKFISITYKCSIRNGRITHAAEISGNFKKPLLKGSNLRNTLK